MERNLLRQIITDQHEASLSSPNADRELFPKIVAASLSPHINIIMGIRRCGKSTLMQQLRSKSNEADYYLNFDDDRLVQFQLEDFQQLLELFIELYGPQKTVYFDEIQNIPDWERFVRRLHDQGYKVYITGSNATLFSRELGTRLTGRYVQYELYPFSFKEFLNWRAPNLLTITHLTSEQKSLIKNQFAQFIDLGGIPEYVQYQQRDYLHSLHESILYRDIIARYKITSDKTLRELSLYLASNASKEISFNALRKILGLASTSTVSNYCGYLQDSFLYFFLNRFHHSLKKQIQFAKKTYCIDIALAKTIGFRSSEDHGRILENIVFLELKRRGKEIFFHREKNECDFLVREGKKITAAYQVCYSLTTPTTRIREFAGLLEARTLYNAEKCYLLTYDEEGTEIISQQDQPLTVEIIPVWRWLLTPPT